jgi:Protein of unknown function (DUF1217)
MISGRLDTWLKTTAAQPAVANDSKTYLARVEKIRSIDEFLKDDRVYRYAMKAFGLEDMTYAKGFMRRVLTEGVDLPSSFANQLSDGRYREFASTFDFKQYGATTTIFDRTRQGTVDRFLRQSFEETTGAKNENVRLALYFQRKAPSITSPLQILADRALTQVVYTALALSPTTSLLNIDAQARLISNRLQVSDFQSPEKLSKFIARFAGLADLATGAARTSSAATSILSRSNAASLNADLLLAVQNIRRGDLR